MVVAAGLALLWALAFRPAPAQAHPLGNFTINHYDGIEVAADGITVYRVLDMAEIPAFQERQRIDSDGDGDVSASEADAWAAAKVDDLAKNMLLVVDGGDVALTPQSHDITFPDGQAGLKLLRLAATYRAALPAGWRDRHPAVEFTDSNYADRLGWREIVVRAGSGVSLVGSTARDSDVSDELLHYPSDALASPLDDRSVQFSFGPGVGSEPAPDVNVDHATATRGNPDSTLGRFSALIAKKDLGFGVVALALLAALGFGALHALSPGHGKTIVAAYLVGSRGTAKHALILALTVTATHTSSVYAIGLITLYLS
jgi:hypothetical protein